MIVKTRVVAAMDVPLNGVFFWNGTLWVVMKHDATDPTYIDCKQIASNWTDNPYDRVQHGEYQADRFNGYCQVEEILSIR